MPRNGFNLRSSVVPAGNPVSRSAASKLRGALLLALAVSCLFTLPVRAATPAQVDTAMQKAIAVLYATQHDGNWENVPVRSPAMRRPG